MIWGEWLSYVGSALGCTTEQAGVIMSMIFSAGFLVAVLVATRGKEANWTVPCVLTFFMVLFVYVGWMPLWAGSLLAMLFATFIALQISGKIGGYF